MARPIRKREDIEVGVVRVVAEKGLHATTIQDIAQAAEVSPGLLYRYWKNRDDLAREVYERLYRQLVGELIERAGAYDDPWDQLTQMLRGFLAFADRQPVELRFLLLAQHDLARSVPLEAGILQYLTGVISGAVPAGGETPAPVIAQMALGIILQPVVGVLYGDLPGPPSRYGDTLEQAIQTLLQTQAQPAEQASS